MVDTFPARRFGFVTKEPGIEGQTLRGGRAISGDEDVSRTDGGGRVFMQFADGAMVDRSNNLGWSAIIGLLEGGVTPMVVPLCDARHQPVRAPQGVPHSDDSPFGDGSLYGTGAGVGNVLEPAALRGVTLVASLVQDLPLEGGEWFGIEHPSAGWRAYKVLRVLAQSTATVSIEFRPPLREAVAVGEAVDFANPRCIMVQSGEAGTPRQYGRLGTAAIRFVEAPITGN